MREILAQINTWQQQGKEAALATIVAAYGSAPRPLGSKMAISSAGEITGSVSGGCVEGAVAEEALQVLHSRQPKLLKFGISDETAWNVGLTCGGTIEVFVEVLDWQILGVLQESLQKEQLIAQVTAVGVDGSGGRMLVWPDNNHTGSLGSDQLDHQALKLAREHFQTQQNGREIVQTGSGEADLFIEVFPPPPRLVVIGAVHIAIPLVSMAKLLGFHTTVIDPRKSFATRERFPHPDELITKWPDKALAGLTLDEGTYLVTLSHDDKLDVPALKTALDHPVRYIGALGSRKTHAKRVEALLEAGVDPEQIGRIHTPVGLDIGSIYPEEIALAVMAEIVAARRGKISGSCED